jgi:protein dithiol oxidoreductase (disulfide-forming)
MLFNLTIMATEIDSSYYKRLPIQTKQQEAVMRIIANSKKEAQVLLFFSYGCHICFLIEQEYSKWIKKKPTIESFKIPVTGNKPYDFWARVFYITKTLDKSEQLSKSIFEAIYLHRMKLWQEDLMADFLASKISPSNFKKMLTSFLIDTEVKQGIQLARSFNIIDTPNFIVISKRGIFFTNLVLTRDLPTLFATLDYLSK